MDGGGGHVTCVVVEGSLPGRWMMSSEEMVWVWLMRETIVDLLEEVDWRSVPLCERERERERERESR